MMLDKGHVVRSAAGHDKGGFFVVLQSDEQTVLLCDGRRRTLEKPKRKKLKHIFVTNTSLPESSMGTNRGIKKALRPFNEQSIS